MFTYIQVDENNFIESVINSSSKITGDNLIKLDGNYSGIENCYYNPETEKVEEEIKKEELNENEIMQAEILKNQMLLYQEQQEQSIILAELLKNNLGGN